MTPNPRPDEFERSLARQPLKPIPGEWRAQILAAAHGAGSADATAHTSSRRAASALREFLAGLLWPHPKAWAGLAVAWAVILVLHLAASETPANGDPSALRPSADALAELRAEHKLYAELLEAAPVKAADGDRRPAHGPRSGRPLVPKA